MADMIAKFTFHYKELELLHRADVIRLIYVIKFIEFYL